MQPATAANGRVYPRWFLFVKAYDPNEARDAMGRWTAGGAGAVTDSRGADVVSKHDPAFAQQSFVTDPQDKYRATAPSAAVPGATWVLETQKNNKVRAYLETGSGNYVLLGGSLDPREDWKQNVAHSVHQWEMHGDGIRMGGSAVLAPMEKGASLRRDLKIGPDGERMAMIAGEYPLAVDVAGKYAKRPDVKTQPVQWTQLKEWQGSSGNKHRVYLSVAHLNGDTESTDLGYYEEGAAHNQLSFVSENKGFTLDGLPQAHRAHIAANVREMLGLAARDGSPLGPVPERSPAFPLPVSTPPAPAAPPHPAVSFQRKNATTWEDGEYTIKRHADKGEYSLRHQGTELGRWGGAAGRGQAASTAAAHRTATTGTAAAPTPATPPQPAPAGTLDWQRKNATTWEAGGYTIRRKAGAGTYTLTGPNGKIGDYPGRTGRADAAKAAEQHDTGTAAHPAAVATQAATGNPPVTAPPAAVRPAAVFPPAPSPKLTALQGTPTELAYADTIRRRTMDGTASVRARYIETEQAKGTPDAKIKKGLKDLDYDIDYLASEPRASFWVKGHRKGPADFLRSVGGQHLDRDEDYDPNPSYRPPKAGSESEEDLRMSAQNGVKYRPGHEKLAEQDTYEYDSSNPQNPKNALDFVEDRRAMLAHAAHVAQSQPVRFRNKRAKEIVAYHAALDRVEADALAHQGGQQLPSATAAAPTLAPLANTGSAFRTALHDAGVPIAHWDKKLGRNVSGVNVFQDKGPDGKRAVFLAYSDMQDGTADRAGHLAQAMRELQSRGYTADPHLVNGQDSGRLIIRKL